MSTERLSTPTHLFTVRLWAEELDYGKAEWRGKVTHVLSGETRYFREWADGDNLSVLSFLDYAAWMQEQIGFVLPIIGGEGGWLFGAEKDPHYPKVERALHAQYHKEMFDWLRTGVLINGEPLPDYVFSITGWIAGSWTFGGQNWWGNLVVPETALVDTIGALQAIPPFVRKFSWDR